MSALSSRGALCAALAIVALCSAGPVGCSKPSGSPEAATPDGTGGDAVDPGCEQSCEALGLECGEHCGQSCGTCAHPNEQCQAGHCVCSTPCSLDRCGQPNGCGGTCAACPNERSCTDCPLQLSVIGREQTPGGPILLTLALDFAPAEGAPLPGMADVRLAVTGGATLTEVATGGALIAADKGLHVDSATGQPYHELDDGTLQFLVLSTTNTTPIGAGRFLVLRFRVGDAFAAPSGPATFALVAREEIFAPPPADATLWGTPIGTPVAIWPQVNP